MKELTCITTNIFFLNEQTTRITDIITESIISTLNGETAGKSSDNLWLPMLKSCRNLIWLEDC